MLCLLRACMISSANSDLSLFPLHITTIVIDSEKIWFLMVYFFLNRDYVQEIQLRVS